MLYTALKNWLLYYPLERLAAPLTDGLIVINDEDYQAALKMGFKAGENLFYVPGVGVEMEKYTRYPEPGALRKELGISQEEIVITCVAEFSPVKNHAFLLKAWEK